MTLNSEFCMGNWLEREVNIFLEKKKFKYFIKNA